MKFVAAIQVVVAVGFSYLLLPQLAPDKTRLRRRRRRLDLPALPCSVLPCCPASFSKKKRNLRCAANDDDCRKPESAEDAQDQDQEANFKFLMGISNNAQAETKHTHTQMFARVDRANRTQSAPRLTPHIPFEATPLCAACEMSSKSVGGKLLSWT